MAQPSKQPSVPAWAGTRTTYFTITTTATPYQASIGLEWPNPPQVIPNSYSPWTFTDIPGSTVVIPIQYLVLTGIVGVVASPDGVPIETTTYIQEPPIVRSGAITVVTSSLTVALPNQTASVSRTSITSTKTNTSSKTPAPNASQPSCSAWNCWPKSQQIGTIFGIVIITLLIFAAIIWGSCRKQKKVDMKPAGDIERRGSQRIRRPPRGNTLTGRFRVTPSSSSVSKEDVTANRRTLGLSVGGEIPERRQRGYLPDVSSSPGIKRTSRGYAVPFVAALGGAGLATASTAGGIRSEESEHGRSSVARDDDELRGLPYSANPSRRTSREKCRGRDWNQRPRSHSPARRRSSHRHDNKRSHSNEDKTQPSRWRAIAPLILAAVNILSEPKGGWDKYLPEDKEHETKAEKVNHEIVDKYHNHQKKNHPSYKECPAGPRSQSAGLAYSQLKPRTPRPSHEDGDPGPSNRQGGRSRGADGDPGPSNRPRSANGDPGPSTRRSNRFSRAELEGDAPRIRTRSSSYSPPPTVPRSRTTRHDVRAREQKEVRHRYDFSDSEGSAASEGRDEALRARGQRGSAHESGARTQQPRRVVDDYSFRGPLAGLKPNPRIVGGAPRRRDEI